MLLRELVVIGGDIAEVPGTEDPKTIFPTDTWSEKRAAWARREGQGQFPISVLETGQKYEQRHGLAFMKERPTKGNQYWLFSTPHSRHLAAWQPSVGILNSRKEVTTSKKQ